MKTPTFRKPFLAFLPFTLAIQATACTSELTPASDPARVTSQAQGLGKKLLVLSDPTLDLPNVQDLLQGRLHGSNVTPYTFVIADPVKRAGRSPLLLKSTVLLDATLTAALKETYTGRPPEKFYDALSSLQASDVAPLMRNLVDANLLSPTFIDQSFERDDAFVRLTASQLGPDISRIGRHTGPDSTAWSEPEQKSFSVALLLANDHRPDVTTELHGKIESAIVDKFLEKILGADRDAIRTSFRALSVDGLMQNAGRLVATHAPGRERRADAGLAYPVRAVVLVPPRFELTSLQKVADFGQ